MNASFEEFGNAFHINGEQMVVGEERVVVEINMTQIARKSAFMIQLPPNYGKKQDIDINVIYTMSAIIIKYVLIKKICATC